MSTRSLKSKIKVNDAESNIIGHMCYAAYKLWNICNYERHNYKELELPVDYPNWYYQKSAYKDNMWYKSLPSQTAQEVLKVLDESWKSFYALQRSKGIENPKPPKYKQDNIVITYIQKAIVHNKKSDTIRLSLPKKLMEHMSSEYGINEKYLYLKSSIFKNIDNIKQIKIYPPIDGQCEIIIVYKTNNDIVFKEDNGKQLSIDFGIKNLLTCYDDSNSKSFIIGREYLSIERYFQDNIAYYQSINSKQQVKLGVEYPKPSKKILKLYKNKNNKIHDYLHKVTHNVVRYCIDNDITSVVIGDITGILKKKNNTMDNTEIESIPKFANKNQDQLHSWPFKKLCDMLIYKLEDNGITCIKVKECYSSQCSPTTQEVSKEYANLDNRVQRGCYIDNKTLYNADVIGAYNIMRIAYSKNLITKAPTYSKTALSMPSVMKIKL